MTIALDLLRVEATEVDPLYATHPGDYVTRGNHWLAAAQTYLNSPISTKEPTDQVQAVGHRVNVVVHHLNELWDKGYRPSSNAPSSGLLDNLRDVTEEQGRRLDPRNPESDKALTKIVVGALVVVVVLVLVKR